MSTDVFAVIATKATDGQQVVFAIVPELDAASHLVATLTNFGLPAALRKVRAGTAWAGMNWPARTVAHE